MPRKQHIVIIGATILTLLAGSTAAAQVVGDGENVAIGTEGENVSARYVAVSNGGNAFARNVAVSNGGNASTWPAESVALSTTGSANGYLAASATGCSTSDVGVALSVTGCAAGWRAGASGTGWSDSAYLAASGTQCAHSTTVGVSATGCAEGWITGASGTGNATGGMTAVSGTGNANSGMVAVSPGGQANGYVVGATVWGNSSGNTASVDPDRTVGDQSGTAWDALATTDVYYHNGRNFQESAYQSWLIATLPPPDPGALANKAQEYATELPETTYKLATGIDLPVPEAPTQSSASTGGGSDYEWYTAWPVMFNLVPQVYDDGCTPAAGWAAYGHRGMPSYQQLYDEMGTAESNGTTLKAAAPVLRNHYNGASGGKPHHAYTESAVDLMNKITTMVKWHDQGVMVGVEVSSLDWWNQPNGAPRAGPHTVTAYSAFHGAGGVLFVADPGGRKGGSVYGFHGISLAQLFKSNAASANEIIW